MECNNPWKTFQSNFNKILKNNEYYSKQIDIGKKISQNILLYGAHGFPTDLLIEEIVKNKFDILTVHKTECMWNKDIEYFYNPHFIEVDLMRPSATKHTHIILQQIKEIVQNKNISGNKHFIIIKHIDILKKNDYNSFRIILEKYSNNVCFLCLTHKPDKIDIPVKSRFVMIRVPLFQHSDICLIFEKYLNLPLNIYLKRQKTRNIVHAIFIAQIEQNSKESLSKEFCTLRFPPIKEFMDSFKKSKNNLEHIRQFSYKCFQYNISISDLLHDILTIVSSQTKFRVIQYTASLEHMLCLTNKGREPIYIESMLSNILFNS